MPETELSEVRDRRFVISLDEEDATNLELTGGKGANLARLVEAGMPVPAGACVTTAAYQVLVDEPDIRAEIESLEGLDPGSADEIATKSEELKTKIRETEIPEHIQRAISNALDTLDADSYAVRSSATAEDLPTASFAGMHETFLGIDQENVLEYVQECIASLFTERAMSYRLRNDVSHSEVAMAVVVQTMVKPEIAGVLFTADSVSGNRHIASIDANYGLGDTVVAGDVSPDNARVDRRTGEVLEYEVGEKHLALRSGKDGQDEPSLEEVSTARRESRALTDAQLRELVELGEDVEELLGSPQDIEWALVDGEFMLLQSRPITSLYPLPSPVPADDQLHIYFSIGHQQAMAEALPPLVVDWMQETVNRSVARFQSAESEQSFAVEAGHRVYVDLTPLLRGEVTRKIALRVLDSMSEPATRALEDILDRHEDTLSQDTLTNRLRKLGRVSRRLLPLVVSNAPDLLARLLKPFLLGPPDAGHVRARIERAGKTMAARVTHPESRSEQIRVGFEETELGTLVASVGSKSMPYLLAGVMAGNVLERLYPDADDELTALSRGFDEEIATEINQRLGDLADIAREHPDVEAAIRDESSLSEIEDVDGGTEFVAAFETFLDDFGFRASNEIDLSRSRWRDDPSMLFQTIQSNLRSGDHGEHREHLAQLKQDAGEAAETLENRASRGLLGPVKRPIVGQLIQVYRGGIQLREHHKHGAARFLAAVHDVVSDTGTELARAGVLEHQEDVWFLRKRELLNALDGESSFNVDISERRDTHQRYASLSAPPILTSEGETPTGKRDGSPSEHVLTGTPVSSGVVEGVAKVMHDPSEQSISKGEILVAPSTDVGWTPLFQDAAGLVMEVGGRMTHGALVAREYGIPAVVSVANATNEIRTGERIRIDGERGTVELLDRTDQSTGDSDSESKR
ncbi:PEP/pyruvate-binding domain-containing protein [Halorussus sp. MSC15.2]|uniref:PEP/pyruvate-binding domain-containing protein n=1 Tax=Halorussus sp. MSC15.2 TaxID=2283638 RepID=UPI0013D6F2F1|nr:PEP/pyruvate-binding domain-containing protein [Halorussus sp. MSC15.2]NEU58766.1 phosphoenolpyruvate protein kinase [Halorussus sp. MSC15.2]